MIVLKTAYNELKELSTAGIAYPADGAFFLIQTCKHLFIGHKIDKILNTWIADFHFPVEENKTLQKDYADSLEWEGPFVFVINNQKIFINFSAPEHYEIGINSQNITEIIDISSKNIVELKKYTDKGKFVDISFLYDDFMKQKIKDIHAIIDKRNKIAGLAAILFELQNSVCFVVSEEIDNPKIRVYANKRDALTAIDKQKEQNCKFYTKPSR